MVHEISATEIIALLIEKSKQERVTIKIKNVISIGCKVEDKHPSVFVDTDRYSFHSFASICKDSITMTKKEIVIDKTNTVLHNKLERLLPTITVRKYIEEVIGQFNQ